MSLAPLLGKRILVTGGQVSSVPTSAGVCLMKAMRYSVLITS